MSLQAKYNSVLELTQQVGLVDSTITEENGVLNIGGTVYSAYQKDQIWNTIKDVPGTNSAEIIANIQVAETGFYTKHTVQKGESLSAIAKHYCGDMMKYQAIFEANRDQLKSADAIEVGQELVIPFLV
jgi:nucleoid-associated protein YgaU